MAQQLGSDQQLSDHSISTGNISSDGIHSKEELTTLQTEPEENSEHFNFIESSHAAQVYTCVTWILSLFYHFFLYIQQNLNNLNYLDPYQLALCIIQTYQLFKPLIIIWTNCMSMLIINVLHYNGAGTLMFVTVKVLKT